MKKQILLVTTVLFLCMSGVAYSFPKGVSPKHSNPKSEALRLMYSVFQQMPEGHVQKLVVSTAVNSLYPDLANIPFNELEIVYVKGGKAENVINAFVIVPAKYLVDDFDIFKLNINEDAWNAFIDVESNNLLYRKSGEPRTVASQFRTLFYFGNSPYNPEMLRPMDQGGMTDWSKMLHPGKTSVGSLLLPVATVYSVVINMLPKELM